MAKPWYCFKDKSTWGDSEAPAVSQQGPPDDEEWNPDTDEAGSRG